MRPLSVVEVEEPVKRRQHHANMQNMGCFSPSAQSSGIVPLRQPIRTLVTAVVALVVLGMSASSHAQLGGRRAATLEALAMHRVFFHGQEVIVQADVIGDGVLAYLVDDTTRLLVLNVPPPPDSVRERLEIIGVFYDIGRFEPDDPRTSGQPFERLSESLLHKPWPGVGELPVLVAASARAAAEPSAPTLRTVALDPERYVAQGVTLTGRFRGRNLYGDLPEAPGESRYDFVLVSAEAAVWVVGQEPKGDGFELDVQARVDTGRWLEVRGEVRFAKGMVLIEAGTITLVDPPKKPVSPAVLVETRRAPPPEVIFTAPLEGDVDVPSDTTVRIQFSRDMDPDAFEGQVRINYAAAASVDPADADPPVTDFEVEYLGRNRVLLIRFVEELESFRTLNVKLLEGITASDGVPIESWALSFFVGG